MHGTMRAGPATGARIEAQNADLRYSEQQRSGLAPEMRMTR
jgi:hypothetical protein